jgi:hypothetical protein
MGQAAEVAWSGWGLRASARPSRSHSGVAGVDSDSMRVWRNSCSSTGARRFFGVRTLRGSREISFAWAVAAV